ncbi:MAG: tyrosine--tRNA ligase, partial [Candidatus Aminicenantes bacterium]|nr:tyrosine--tRNA ligase [Candidatus Aminicenantes bacterium]
MIHDIMPGTEEFLLKESTAAYIGFDPTADSLHIGHLVSVMILKHFQLAGHKPIVLLGGATGMIGDPSGRSDERNLLSEETLRKNQEAIKKQLAKFLDFNKESANSADLVNNYDWMKDFSFLEFIREIGKHITVNYMMSKDSVKKRIGEESKTGMSFTEFSYQLVQATDFLELYKTKNCRLQMGGSDQWGNIITGTELIRRKTGGEAFALTCPLITKSDGSKFGKTEGGNVWLDPSRTSPYKFYQFWLNTSDDDAGKYIKIFTALGEDEIKTLSEEHKDAPHLRILQKRLAKELTAMVHSEEDVLTSEEASRILFGKGTKETLTKISESDFLNIFEGVPRFDINNSDLKSKINILDLLAVQSSVCASKGEARRMIKSGGVSINKERIEDPDKMIGEEDLLNGKYILIQIGKKKYSLLTII